VHIEARVDQRRDAGAPFEGDDDIVVKRVDIAADDLRSGRTIDMDDRPDRPAPLWKDSPS
jgi:hypothetical protein